MKADVTSSPGSRYLSDDPPKVENYPYNDRDEVTAEPLKALVNGVWGTTDRQGVNRHSTFTYDHAQNRETASLLGQWDDPTPNAVNEPGTLFGLGVAYDADGNLTSDGTWTYAYDAENRLKSSSGPGVTITYTYDYLGRRVEMRGNSWMPAKRYLWDGWHLVADLWPDAGSAMGGSYVWGPDVSGTIGGAGGVGGLVLQFYNGRAFVPLQDGRGNIHGYLDTGTRKNAVAWDFSATGETIHVRGGLAGAYYPQDFPLRYQSKAQDIPGHLVYYGYRYYHPRMGRFINRDPAGEQGGVNLHALVANNFPNAYDLLGLAGDLIMMDGGGGRSLGFDVILPRVVVTATRIKGNLSDLIGRWTWGWRSFGVINLKETSEGAGGNAEPPKDTDDSNKTAAPNNTEKETNDCYDFVDGLLATAAQNNSRWWDESQTGAQIIDQYTPTGSDVRNRFGNYFYNIRPSLVDNLGDPTNPGELRPVSGLLPELVQGNQNAGVYFHVAANAGLYLQGFGSLGAYYQSNTDMNEYANGVHPLAQTLAEVAGNFRGVQVGEELPNFLQDKQSESATRDRLRSLLCK